MVQMRAGQDTEHVRGKRRAILEVAARCFRERGFHDTSMRDIARAAGMTVSNLYYYFANKKALLAYCQHDTLGRLLACAGLGSAGGTGGGSRAADALYLALVGHVLALNEGMPGSLAHLEVEALAPRERAQCVQRRDQYERAVRALVRRGVDDGSFRAVDASIAVWTMLGAVNGTARWFHPGGKLAALDLARDMAEQLVRGILLAPRGWKPPAIPETLKDTACRSAGAPVPRVPARARKTA